MFSRPIRSPEAEEVKKKVLNVLEDPLINTSEEIEIIVNGLNEEKRKKLERIAKKYGYEMEVVR